MRDPNDLFLACNNVSDIVVQSYTYTQNFSALTSSFDATQGLKVLLWNLPSKHMDVLLDPFVFG
jgi:hypothetical protein